MHPPSCRKQPLTTCRRSRQNKELPCHLS
jgi:hypothetical protein